MKELNLYRLTISVSLALSYNAYDMAVVAAVDEDAASRMHPDGCSDTENWGEDWASSPGEVNVELIGKAAVDIVEGVVLSSFNAAYE